MNAGKKCVIGAKLMAAWEMAQLQAARFDTELLWKKYNRALADYRAHNAGCPVCHRANDEGSVVSYQKRQERIR